MKRIGLLLLLVVLAAGSVGGETKRVVHETTIVSVASDGSLGNSASGWVNIPDGIDVSNDGRYIVFSSNATNLVANDTNNKSDVFLHDTQNSMTTRVSVDSDGTQSDKNSHNPSISGDGRYVVFYSHATNLVANDTNNKSDIFLHDAQNGMTTRVSVASDDTQSDNSSHDP